MTLKLIALAVSLAALAFAAWSARSTRQSADRARAANREAWGLLAEAQLLNLKRRQRR
jgi:hypothetical protein